MLFSQNYLLLSHYFAYKLYNSYIRNIKPTKHCNTKHIL